MPQRSPPNRSLPVGHPTGAIPAAGRAHARFAKLLAQIGERRASIALWRDYHEVHQRRLAGELAPAELRWRKAQVSLARLLDRALGDDLLRRADARHAEAVLVDLLEHLLADAPDPALQQIHERYGGARRRGFEHSARTTRPLQDAEEAPQPEPPGTADSEQPRSGARNGSTKRGARAAQAAADAASAMRQLYRRLVSALHPDREAEETARLRKTELMQRVNRAYESQDLLSLLEISRQQGVDAAREPSESPHLAHYNVALQQQLQELDAELERLTAPLAATLGRRSRALTPEHVERALNTDLRVLQKAARELEQDVRLLRDPDILSAWLREQRRGARLDDDEPEASPRSGRQRRGR
jgi:hypothetical protein